MQIIETRKPNEQGSMARKALTGASKRIIVFGLIYSDESIFLLDSIRLFDKMVAWTG